MFKTKIKNWTKKILIGSLLAFVFSITAPTFVAIVDAPIAMNQQIAYAEDPVATPVDAPADPAVDPPVNPPADTDGFLADADPEQKKRIITAVLSFQAFASRILWPVLLMTGGLMDNSILFGNGMEEQIRGIWVPIRNLTNIIFVLILVGIALYNVLGIGGEDGNYSLKAILPRIVVGIIAVNFSFLGIKVFLDGINVMTTSIFALPDQVNEGLAEVINSDDPKDTEVINRFCLLVQGETISGPNLSPAKDQEYKRKGALLSAQQAAVSVGYTAGIPKEATEESIRNAVVASINDDKALSGEERATLIADYDKYRNQFNEGRLCEGLSLSDSGKKMLQSYTSRSAAMAFVLNMSNIVFTSELDLSVDTLEKMTTNVLFSLLLYVIYVVSFLALFIVLLARLVVLWLAVVISPILILGYTVPLVKEKISAFDTINEQFVKNAIAPITISLAMTVGWIMLKSIQGINNAELGSIYTSFEAGQIPVHGLSTIQDLMVMAGTVAVVWLGVFSAADGTIAEAVTGTMKSGLQRAAGWLVKTPLNHVKLIPIKLPGSTKAEPFTLGQVGRVFTNLGSTPSNIDDLYKKITGNENAITPASIELSDGHEDFIRRGKGLREANFKDTAYQDAIKTWFTKPENNRALDTWTKNKGRQGLYEQLTKYVKEGTTKEEKDKIAPKLVEEFKRIQDDMLPKVDEAKAATKTAPPTPPAGGAAANPVPPVPPVPQLAAGTTIGSITINEAQAAAATALAADYATTPITTENKAEVVGKLKAIKDLNPKDADGKDVEFSFEAVQKFLGNDAKAEELAKLYDDKDALLDDLNK